MTAIAQPCATLWTMLERIGYEQEGINYFVEQLHPLWSLTATKAEVVNIIQETANTKTFVLSPNRRWNGHRAGQNIGINVEIEGVIHRRRYSVVSTEGAGAIEITVKRVEDGLVSNFLHDDVSIGDVFTVDSADGDFVVPESFADYPEKLLALCAGSGITPVYAQVVWLLENGYQGDIQFVHYIHSKSDAIFRRQLQMLSIKYDNFTVNWCVGSGAINQPAERYSGKQLASVVADHTDRHTLLCGPAGFMQAVREDIATQGREDQLSYEYFGLPAIVETGEDAELVTANGKSINVAAGTTLLDAMLDNGETPKYGCKRGVCHECKCRKSSGVVKNLLTGKESGAGEEDIQLCISAPITSIQLA